MSAVIAIPGLRSDVAGAVTFWHLSGAVKCEALHTAWSAAGLDASLLPSVPTETVALKRALSTYKAYDVLIKPIRGEDTGYILVHEKYRADGRPVYTHGLEVRLIPEQALPLVTPDDETERRAICRAYTHHLAHYGQTDISSWLVRLANNLRAVPLRETGGVYFVPRDGLDMWRAYSVALGAASACVVHRIPALHSDEAVAAALDAVTREASEAALELGADIDSGLSARAVRSRTERASKVEAKIAHYEELLGVKMEALRKELEQIQARLVHAALLAEGE